MNHKQVKTFLKAKQSLIIVFLLTLPALLPLMRTGFFNMHDDQQVVRLFELDRALASGQFPARWVQNLGFGYGYPLFIFYPPFVYYLGEVFHLGLGVSYITSIKLVFVIAFLGAAFTMFLWVKEHFGKIPGIIAAAFYTYAPYHAVDAYVRGALAELFSFVWLPLILLSADRLILKNKRIYALWIGVLLALLMLTHNLIFLPFLPLFLIYTGIFIWKSDSRVNAIRSMLFVLLISFSLSAFFWIPALSEKKYTLVDTILLSELATYKLHFVELRQLWNSLWGYGGSTAGSLDGLSFKIGKLHIVFAILTPLVWFFVNGKKEKQKIFYILIVGSLFLLSCFMTTYYSLPIWQSVKPLQYLQFPWRYLTFAALFSAFLSGAAIACILKWIQKRIANIPFSLGVLILLIFPNLKLFAPQTYLDVDDEYYVSDEFIKWRISKTSFEFVPKEVNTTTEFNPLEKKEITQLKISEAEIARSPFELISGKGDITVKRNVAGKFIATTNSEEDMLFQYNSFDFPGWSAFIDGNRVDHSSNNPLHLIQMQIPAGIHQIEIKFKETPIRSMSNLISLFSLSIILFYYFQNKSYEKSTTK